MEIISSRPTARSPYSLRGWRFIPSSTMLDVCVALRSRFPALGFPIILFMSYSALLRVWLLWYVLDVWLLQFDWPSSTLSRGRQLRAPSQERCFVLVPLGECELPGSGVHLLVWLMSQEFPEAESPAGFAALDCSARFPGPAHQGFGGFRCLSGIRDQHTEGAVPRTGRATLKDHHCGRVTRRDS